MNKIRLSLPILAVLFFSTVLALKSFEVFENERETESEETEDFTAPADHFFFQRSFPESSFNLDAYKKALESAREVLSERTGDAISSVDWTQQGPGNLGGRVNAIAVHPTDENTIYIGFSGGGIFKTTDGGTNWEPIFDQQPYLSIGDIEIDPRNPNTIYVGTGDPNVTSNPFIGNGVYRSRDAGRTWEHLGLAPQAIISKIIIDPNNSNVLYAACLGSPFEVNTYRGLYKSIDGGKTWLQQLYINNQCGLIDLVMDPSNPQVLYAAGWDRVRTNYVSIAEGSGSRIYKTTDGGKTWSTLSNGLPTSINSRIGLTISRTNPGKLYACIMGTDYKLKGIYKTTNGGQMWAPIPTGIANGLPADVMGLPAFGWYFGKIVLNPVNENELYLLGVELWKTSNEGTRWDNAAPSTIEIEIHVDKHALVFTNSGTALLGTDGGAYRLKPGQSWEDIENIPVTQFYRVAYNPHMPDLFYGGAQDNGTSSGNSQYRNEWDRIYDGDGFQPLFHPTNPNKYFVETQNGNIYITYNGMERARKFQKIDEGLDTTKNRNWNMPYIMGKRNPERLYCGTYRVYKMDLPALSTQPHRWVPISPDLTDPNATSEDRFHNISCLGESPIDSNLLLAGTSDGRLWITSNAGASWSMISNGLPTRYITSVVPSPTDVNTIYVTLSGYKDNENTPHVFKSTNRGQSWASVAGNLPALAVNDLIVLPGRRDSSMFVATDGGVYASLNGGQQWQRLGSNMPFIPVFDLEMNVLRNELIAGTFARSVMSFPLDSINLQNNQIANINGSVQTEGGAGISLVMVKVNNFSINPSFSDASGSFNFWGLPSGISLTIQPEKNTNHANGVSTRDMVEIKKHILGLQLFDSPYKYIAADVNNNGTITTFDLVQIRKVILQIDTTFMGNTSWRFIPASFVFPTGTDPLSVNYPELVNISKLSTVNDLNFVGIKIGDVTGDAKLNALAGAENRSAGTVFFETEESAFTPGSRVTVPIRARDANRLSGFQCTFHFHQDHLEWLGWDQGALPDFGTGNIGLTRLSAGSIALSWDGNTGALQPDDILFSLVFRAKTKGSVARSLSITSAVTTAEAYDLQMQRYDIGMTFQKAGQADRFEVFPNEPNPFVQQTWLPFHLPEGGTVNAFVYDAGGRLVKQTSSQYQPGINRFQLDAAELPGKGVYYCRLNWNGQEQVTRIVRM